MSVAKAQGDFYAKRQTLFCGIASFSKGKGADLKSFTFLRDKRPVRFIIHPTAWLLERNKAKPYRNKLDQLQ